EESMLGPKNLRTPTMRGPQWATVPRMVITVQHTSRRTPVLADSAPATRDDRADGVRAFRALLGGAPVTVIRAVPARPGGTWQGTRTLPVSAPATDAVLRLTAANGAPPSTLDLVRNGQLVGRIATRWALQDGMWVVVERRITRFDGGRPVSEFVREVRNDGVSGGGGVARSVAAVSAVRAE